jgi:hypothetical protein
MVEFPAGLKKQRPKARSFPETPSHLVTKKAGAAHPSSASPPASDQPHHHHDHDHHHGGDDDGDGDADFYGTTPQMLVQLPLLPPPRLLTGCRRVVSRAVVRVACRLVAVDMHWAGALKFTLETRIDCRKVPASDDEPLGGIQCLLRVHDRVWCGHAKGHISIWDARVPPPDPPPATPLVRPILCRRRRRRRCYGSVGVGDLS